MMKTQKFDDNIIREREKALWGQSDTPLLIILFAAVYLFVSQIVPAFLLVPVNVIGSSMEPTLESGDRVLLFRQGGFDYGDIVVAYAPDIPNRLSGGMGEDVIKRVMGLPGDTVWFVQKVYGGVTHYVFHRSKNKGSMVVETEIFNESYVIKNSSGIPLYGSASSYSSPPVTLGEGEYYLLGDNRANSTDSRSPLLGVVKREEIKGKALLIIRGNSFWLFQKVRY